MKTNRKNNKYSKGFTLLELLIIVLVLGIIAAVIIPNLASFNRTGDLAAANTEVQNMRSAADGYYAKYEEWPEVTTLPDFREYYQKELRAVYEFDVDGTVLGKGMILDARTDSISNPWPNTIKFNRETQKWEKANP